MQIEKQGARGSYFKKDEFSSSKRKQQMCIDAKARGKEMLREQKALSPHGGEAAEGDGEQRGISEALTG